MVVDNDDVAFLGLLVHPGDEASLELLAFLAAAQIAARIDLRPQAARFGQGFNLGAVAGFGLLLPRADDLEIRHFFQALQYRFLVGIVNFLAARVIGAALHIASPKRSAEMFLQERDVLEKKLLL